jgi:hypothetical protein
MAYVGQADDWRGAGTAAWRRLAALPYAPVILAAALGALAVAQALWLAVAGAPNGGRTLNGGAAAEWWASLFVLALVSLATTLPLGFLWARPAWAAVIMSAASIVSLAGFQTLTVAGLIAQLAGRTGRPPRSPLLSAALSVPFLTAALAASSVSAAQSWRLVLAARRPGAALAGSARRAQRDAIEHSAAREAIAGTLLEHTARGERARISRELHDVVAHHISMIAVQAETARLTTPGMLAAGAQRLSSIGDTARRADRDAALPGVLRGHRARRGRPSATAGAAPAQRTARRGPGGIRHRDPADPARGPGHPRSRGRARRLPDHSGGPHQRPAARARGGRRCGTALRRRPAAAADPGQRARPARRPARRRPRRTRPGPARLGRAESAWTGATGCSACASGPPPSVVS